MGKEYRQDCVAIGQVCTNGQCMPGNACVDALGVCSGNTYQGCFAGYKINVDCAALGGAGGSGGPGGSGGLGGTGGPEVKAENLISDFEQTEAAVVALPGAPTRRGFWYTYNDDVPKGMDPSCVQTPPAAFQTADGQWVPSIPEAPPSLRPGSTGSLALHAKWTGCTIWGAGIGVPLSWQGPADAGAPDAMQVAYDVTPFTGVTFWAMAAPGSETALRIKLVMTDETSVEFGGLCVESATQKCSDDYGEAFTLSPNGSWKQVTVRWTDVAFRQEGWGALFPWNPQHVLAIQIQSVYKTATYDFWIDDLYFIN
jgi:hypothetical protein